MLKHISWKELDCKDGTQYPYEFVRDGRFFRLVELFEDIRHLCGDKPIIVNSAYRTPEWNKLVNGSENSQHIHGRALDLRHTQMPNEEFFEMINKNIFILGIGGIGKYKNFVHVDIRPGIKVARWDMSNEQQAV